MWQRGLVCLAIILSICVSTVALLPAGPGPYTAVYGPASALRAQRAILMLVLAISFVAAVAALLAALGAAESSFRAAIHPVQRLCPSPIPSTSLRC